MTATGVFASSAIVAAVEVLLGLVGTLVTTFEGHGSAAAFFRSSPFTTARRLHFGALLFQDGFARQLNAIAFDGQHFHQHLVAFLQLVAHIVDAVLGNFADVQQAIGAGNDFDEGAEVRQSRNLAQVGLAYFGGRGDVASTMPRMTLPPGPIRSRILSVGIVRV
jgi:hypothetical protein